jgi:hypothetical protein
MNIEELGQLADSAENFLALKELGPEIALDGMTHGLEEIRDKLREHFVEETGDNPWGD